MMNGGGRRGELLLCGKAKVGMMNKKLIWDLDIWNRDADLEEKNKEEIETRNTKEERTRILRVKEFSLLI